MPHHSSREKEEVFTTTRVKKVQKQKVESRAEEKKRGERGEQNILQLITHYTGAQNAGECLIRERLVAKGLEKERRGEKKR